jgi:Leucine-rich repeat (LRR) protein
MYHYGEEDFREFMPNTFDEFDEDETHEVEEYHDFLTAMKCEYTGSTAFPLDLSDLASFEGEVSLTDYNIHDLDGAQHCKKITGLNLSNNCISSLYYIQFLDNLEELFVSNNEISHIEYLSGMHSLRILDLSYNAVEDIAPLLHLEGLQFVNLEKNPLQNTHLTEELEARSVVVIR